MEPTPGARAESVHVVATADTALALGSGGLPVLGTPRLLAWCESATCRAVEGRLPEGSSTVGSEVHLQHLAPSAPGDRVVVAAVLTDVDGRRLTFAVDATDAGRGLALAVGTVRRIVVDDRRFLARLGESRS